MQLIFAAFLSLAPCVYCAVFDGIILVMVAPPPLSLVLPPLLLELVVLLSMVTVSPWTMVTLANTINSGSAAIVVGIAVVEVDGAAVIVIVALPLLTMVAVPPVATAEHQ